MSLYSIKALGQGGAGLDGRLASVLTELQGLSFAVVVGATANTPIAIAGIRPEDSLVLALQIADAGGATDQTSATSISDTRASATITVGTVVNGNSATVRGKAYTFKTAPVAGVVTDLAILSTPALNAAALAAAINKVEGGTLLKATVASAVVTLTSVAEGTTANSYTVVGSTNVTASGATLSGGTTTGSIKITNSTASSKVLVVYFNKK